MLLDITYLWTLKKYSKQVTDQKASKKKEDEEEEEESNNYYPHKSLKS